MTKAYEKVAAGWTQWAGAKDAEGKATYVDDPTATCWCAEGAINACYINPIPTMVKLRDHLCMYEGVDKELATHDPTIAINSWNDHPSRTQAEVVGVLRRLDI